MRRYPFFLFAFLLLVPVFAAEAQIMQLIPCVGGDSCRACDLVALAGDVINVLIYLSAIVIVMVAAFTGFKMVMGGGGGDLLKTIGQDILKGLIIMLCAWLIVDTGLKILVQDQSFGPWNQIQCINNPSPTTPGVWVPGQPGAPGVVPDPSGYTGRTGGGQQCHGDNVACSVAALQQAGYTEAQANVMSCIAMTESTGNPNAVNRIGGACGTFQALPYHWRQGYAPSGCGEANCTNVQCNIQMAYTLSQRRVQAGQSPYADWTCPGCNNKAAGCVAKYDSR